MKTYRELVDMIRNKNIGHEKIDELMDYGFDVLERTDRRAYQDVMKRMENMAYSFTKDEATSKVRAMRPRGEKWSCDDIKSYLEKKQSYEDHLQMYLCMNAAYNDLYKTAEYFGLHNDAEFFFRVACDFIHDEDGPDLKVFKYFSMQ